MGEIGTKNEKMKWCNYTTNSKVIIIFWKLRLSWDILCSLNTSPITREQWHIWLQKKIRQCDNGNRGVLRNHDDGFEGGGMALEAENRRNKARSEIKQRNQFSRAFVGSNNAMISALWQTF